eukprot:RCo015022
MAKNLRREDKWLSAYDVFWLRNDEPVNQMVMNFCFHLERDVPLPVANEYLANWVKNYPRFSSRPVSAGVLSYAWEPVPDFDPVRSGCLSEHRLSEPTEEALVKYIDESVNELMRKDGVLWRVVCISNAPGGGAVLLWRMHHCLCDGTALVMLFHSIFTSSSPAASTPDTFADRTTATVAATAVPATGSPFSPFSPTEDSNEAAPRPAPKEGATPFLFVASVLTLLLAGAVVTCGRDSRPLSTLLGCAAWALVLTVGLFWGSPLFRAFSFASGLMRPDSASPLKAPLGGHKATTVLPQALSVTDAKALAAKLTPQSEAAKGQRYTVNDLLCALAGGALRRYLSGGGGAAGARVSGGSAVDRMTVRGVVPVNVRRRGEEVRVENKFSFVFVDLPVASPTPQSRVSRMHQWMEEIKRGFDTLLGVFLYHALILLPQDFMAMMVRFYCRRGSLVITNVNARTAAVSFAGAAVTNTYGWVPAAGGIGVGVSFVSYLGKINVGLVADGALVPDLKALSNCFVEELEALQQQ